MYAQREFFTLYSNWIDKIEKGLIATVEGYDCYAFSFLYAHWIAVWGLWLSLLPTGTTTTTCWRRAKATVAHRISPSFFFLLLFRHNICSRQLACCPSLGISRFLFLPRTMGERESYETWISRDCDNRKPIFPPLCRSSKDPNSRTRLQVYFSFHRVRATTNHIC
jgi:hypothetical protein